MTTELTDQYRDALENLIEEKIEHGDKAAPAPGQEGAQAEEDSMKGFLRDNGLSLVLIVLSFFAGQTVFGWLNYNVEKDEHHQPQIGFGQYLGTGALARQSLRIGRVSFFRWAYM